MKNIHSYLLARLYSYILTYVVEKSVTNHTINKPLATGRYPLHGSSILIISGYIFPSLIAYAMMKEYTEIVEIFDSVLKKKYCGAENMHGADLNRGPPAEHVRSISLTTNPRTQHKRLWCF